jgi:hypothetical protein
MPFVQGWVRGFPERRVFRSAKRKRGEEPPGSVALASRRCRTRAGLVVTRRRRKCLRIEDAIRVRDGVMGMGVLARSARDGLRPT